MLQPPRRSAVQQVVQRFAPHPGIAVALTLVAILTSLGIRTASVDGSSVPTQPTLAPVEAPSDGSGAILPSIDLQPALARIDGASIKAYGEFVVGASQPLDAPVAPTAPIVDAPPAAPIEQPAAPQPTSTPVPPSPPPPPPPPAPAIAGLDTSPMDGYSQALFAATNARRAANGLPALRVNGHLTGIARLRSQDMASFNYFAHESPVTGDTAFSLMDAYGVPFGWAGENLAKNNYPENEAVAVADEALWNSAPHRENILNGNYTDIGIALVIDGSGMKYFTIIFTDAG